MAKTKDDEARSALAHLLASLAPRLEPGEAAADARQVLEAMADTADGGYLGCLVEAVESLAARLNPQEASADARMALQAMARTSTEANHPTGPRLGDGLVGAAAWSGGGVGGRTPGP